MTQFSVGWDDSSEGLGQSPDRILLYGIHGVGKTRFGMTSPNPILLMLEDGGKRFQGRKFDLVYRTLDEVKSAIEAIRADSRGHKTLVVDTVDALHAKIAKVVCDKVGKPILEEIPYGKGPAMAAAEWRELLSLLDCVRIERGMEIILLAHSKTENYKNPTGPDYARVVPKMDATSYSLIFEWVDAALYACYDDVVTNLSKDGDRGKGSMRTKARVVRTSRTAAWEAKNRMGLPETLPLSYLAFDEARAAGGETESALRDEALLLVGRVYPGDAARVEKVKSASGDQLIDILTRLRVSDSGASHDQAAAEQPK